MSSTQIEKLAIRSEEEELVATRMQLERWQFEKDRELEEILLRHAIQQDDKGRITVLNFRSVQSQRIEEMQKDLIRLLGEKRNGGDTNEIDTRLHAYGREPVYVLSKLTRQ